jgi:transcriptional regulator with XRE-family HTH domain
LRQPPDFEIERRISARFRELRELKLQSQSQVAKALGATRDRIANIESGRTPLRYREARRALNAQEDQGMTWPFNPLWLAGHVDWPIQMDWPLLLPDTESLELPQALRFSEFVAIHYSLLVALTKDVPDPELPPTWLQPYLFHWLRLHQRESDLGKGVVFVENVFAWSAQGVARTSTRAADLLKKYNKAKLAMHEPNYLEAPKTGDNYLLTDVVSKDNIRAMQDQMQKLRGRLTRATAARGQKAALAKWLGVSLSSVSTWLAGRKEPSGKTTLRLLHWVEQQERQQNKSADSVSPPPAPKTQSKASNEKKPKSSPQER